MKKITYENYKKPSDFMGLSQGENRIRIVSSGVFGYQHGMKTARGWVNLGVCPEDDTCENCKKGHEPKKVWKWLVFDYSDQRTKLIDAGPMIGNQVCDIASKHGDPQEYDILIKRVGEGLKTEYTCEKAKDNKEIPEELKKNIDFNKKRLVNKYFK